MKIKLTRKQAEYLNNRLCRELAKIREQDLDTECRQVVEFLDAITDQLVEKLYEKPFRKGAQS